MSLEKDNINLNDRFEVILRETSALTGQQKSVEIEGREKRSFQIFLQGQQSKNIALDKVLGIGGEGVVIQEELDITVMEGTILGQGDKNAGNIRMKSNEKKIVALKFVPFKEEGGENFKGLGFIIQALFITII